MHPTERYSARFCAITVLWTAALVLSGSANANAASYPDWHGVWRGTIGKAAVQVCLQHKDYGDSGAYYYLRYRSIISLGGLAAPPAASNNPAWTEAPNSDNPTAGPLWHLTSITAAHLRGVWTSGGKTLPIDLASVRIAKSADDDDDMPCGNPAFSLPRFSQPVVEAKPTVLKGVAYTRVIVDVGKQFSESVIESFQLHGGAPAITKVNTQLYKDIPTTPENAMYFQCSMAALGQNGLDGDASSTTVPEIITRDWMVSRTDSSDDCGGAHPNSGSAFQTWDLRKGVTVNLYDWFTAAALKQTVNEPGTKNQYVTVAFTPAFRKMIDDAYKNDEPECRQAEQGADFWDTHLTATGVAFTPELSHADTPCIDDAVIPFAKLGRYLNPTGKAEIASFISALRDQ
jgi:hypothetical protein